MSRFLILATLAVLLLSSALGVVISRHQARTLFVELRQLEAEHDHMNEEWGQLQLEQATWGTHARVEEIANHRLGMIPPPAKSVVMVPR